MCIRDSIRSVHNKSDQIQCNHCGKLMHHNYGLQIHIKAVHENDNRVKLECKSCGKLLATPDSLKKHVRNIHEGIKPVQTDHKCNTCNKVFKEVGTLRKHIKVIHEGIKVQCPICNKTFAGHLKTHIDTVHKGIKKYKCSFCNTAYGQNGDLKKHIKRCHYSQEKEII